MYVAFSRVFRRKQTYLGRNVYGAIFHQSRLVLIFIMKNIPVHSD